MTHDIENLICFGKFHMKIGCKQLGKYDKVDTKIHNKTFHAYWIIMSGTLLGY